MATAYKNAVEEISTKDGIRIANHTGIKYNFLAEDEVRLRRFLTIGTSGGSYYATEHELTKENAEHVIYCLDRYGVKAVDIIAQISIDNIAAKQQPAIFALAIAAAHADLAVRQAALSYVPAVCRTASTHFQFIEYVTGLRGWGRSLKRSVRNWYNDKSVEDVAYQVVKYRNRNGWSHKDLLELGHVLAPVGQSQREGLYNWIFEDEDANIEGLKIVEDFERLQNATSAAEVVYVLRDNHNLPFETIPNQFLKDVTVWNTLVDNGMPMTALMRNLGRMTSLGVFDSQEQREKVMFSLENEKRIEKSRLHPMNIYNSLIAYSSGRSRGTLTWTPNRHIIDVLDSAFYKSFKNVTPSNKRILLAVDVSGSMTSVRANGFENITAAQVSAAMALVTLATEPNADVIGFDDNVRIPNISSRQRLDDVYRGFNFRGGGTNCTLPFQWASSQNKEYDAIVMYTDDEHNVTGRYNYGGWNTPSGQNVVYNAIDAYRARFNQQMRLINVAMVANNLSFCRKTDMNTLDVSGFGSDTPQAISLFAGGNV